MYYKIHNKIDKSLSFDYTGGVRGEERGNVGGVAAQVEPAGGRHPLVEVGGDLLRGGAEGVDVGGDDLAGGVAEQHGLDVVPLARDRIDVVVFPQFLQNLVLAGKKRGEVDEDRRGFALDLPAAHADADAVAVDALTPVAEQVGVFLELGIEAFVREVGTDQQVAVAEFAGRGLCLGRNDGVDAADLVAHLPAHFEQIVRGQFCVAHNLCFRL